MSDEVESLIKRVVLDEITGKNQAIHAYDKMVWTVRTGFLTLVFAGWGLLLSSVADSFTGCEGSDPVVKAWPLLAAMVAVSVGLAVAGFIVDLNYVRRKFRVISALNGLMAVIIEHDEAELMNREFIAKHLRPFLSISGDSGSRDYASVSGYKGARTISLIIYSVPLIGVATAITFLGTVS